MKKLAIRVRQMPALIKRRGPGELKEAKAIFSFYNLLMYFCTSQTISSYYIFVLLFQRCQMKSH